MKNVPITEVMTREVVTVSWKQKLIDVKHIFEKAKFHHHIPVAEQGRLVGMISLVDYLYAIKEASISDEETVYHTLRVGDIMREHPITLLPTATLKDAGEEFLKGEVHAIVIADENKIHGIVSTTDVIRYFMKNS